MVKPGIFAAIAMFALATNAQAGAAPGGSDAKEVSVPFAERIGVETRGTDTLDRYATLIVRDQRCQLTSLVQGAPPKKAKKR